MKIDKEKIIGISILAVVTILLYGVFLMPQGSRLKAIRSQYSSAIKLLNARETKGENLEALRTENRQLREKLYDARNKFLTGEEINLFLKGLTKIAKNTRNELMAVDPLERTVMTESGVEKMFVEVTIAGNYSSIIDFLDVLSSSKKLIDVTDIEIEREGRESRDLTASFEIILFIIEDTSWRL